MPDFSYLSGAESRYIESLYRDYKKDPSSVESDWKKFFDGFEFAVQANGQTEVSEEKVIKELRVLNLIWAYRQNAHLIADTNPVRPRKDRPPFLTLEDHGLTESDLEEQFVAGNEIGLPEVSLKEIIQKLKSIYCGVMGFEYMHIRRKEEREWFRNKIEETAGKINFSPEKKKRILQKLNEAEVFERFLHTKYIGQKRFSLEGGKIPFRHWMLW
jgi:2-oxoglutarate dehydrogenase E1 component